MRNATRNIQFLIVLYEETLLVGKLHVFGGKKDVSKTTEKTDKGRTAKEEAHELLLKEEVAIRKKVKAIQRNLSMVWRAREMAVSNPIRTQSACIHGLSLASLKELCSYSSATCQYTFCLFDIVHRFPFLSGGGRASHSIVLGVFSYSIFSWSCAVIYLLDPHLVYDAGYFSRFVFDCGYLWADWDAT